MVDIFDKTKTEVELEKTTPLQITADNLQDSQPKQGLILGDTYRLEYRLSKGGMGEVWLATHLLLNETRAIKLMLDHVAVNSVARHRFIYGEARNALRLIHPNIVRVYDLGQYRTLPYIVMEYVKTSSSGADLKEWLKTHTKFDLNFTGQILEQIAAGLNLAHQNNLVHRDLKPSNILITQEGQVKITDFGLVKDLTNEVELTGTNYTLGTPLYMAPEQARGKAQIASDIYALGVILYEMLTGQPPFVGASIAELVMHHALAKPRPLTELDPAIPGAIEAVVLRALAKDPTARYNSAIELAAAYQSALTGSECHAAEATNILNDFVKSSPSKVTTTASNLTLPPTNLVPQLNQLLGREQQLAELAALLSQPNTRLVTLTGSGGTGKTRLSLQVATDLLANFRDGVFLVELETLNEPEMLPSAIAQVLGVAEVSGQPIADTVKNYLHDKQMLLVLDNFEQIIAGGNYLMQLLKAAPELKLLVSSRIVLRVSGENEFPVLPLAVPDPHHTIQKLQANSAVKLFLERARKVKPDFTLTDENTPVIAAICARLDGLPLAIELAAGRVRTLPPTKILERLNLKLLTGGARDMPQRQQTLRGAIDWSYDLLEAGEKQLLVQLAFFKGGCSLEAAEQICNPAFDLELEVLEGLDSLICKNLLVRAEEINGEPRYTMLQVIRDYAFEKLAASGAMEALAQDYVNFYLNLIETTAPKLAGANQQENLQLLDVEYPNLRLALQTASEQNAVEAVLRLAGALGDYWRRRNLWSEAANLLDSVLGLSAENYPKLRTKVLTLAATVANFQLDYSRSQMLLEESLAIHRQTGNKSGSAAVLGNLGTIELNRGNYRQAQALLEECLSLSRALDNTAIIANTLNSLGGVMQSLQDYKQAQLYYEEGLLLQRKLNNKARIAQILNNLGVVAKKLSLYAQAENYFAESLKLKEELNDKRGIALTLQNLGALMRTNGDYATAITHQRACLELLQAVGDKAGICQCLEEVAIVLTWQNRFEFAACLFSVTAELRRATGIAPDPALQAECEQTLALIAQALNPAEFKAAQLAGQVMSLAEAVTQALHD